MTRWTLRVLVLFLFAGLATMKTEEKTEEKDEGAIPEELEFSFEQAKEELAAIGKAIEAGEDVDTDCAAAMSYAEDIEVIEGNEQVTNTVEELEKLCTFEGPLAAAVRQVEAAEKAREEQPDETVLSECYNADYDMAIKALTEGGHAEHEKVVAVVERWTTVCPPKDEEGASDGGDGDAAEGGGETAEGDGGDGEPAEGGEKKE